MGAYISKYMGKKQDDERFGKKCFWGSRGLLKPLECKFLGQEGKREVESLQATLFPFKTFQSTFEHLDLGLISYTQYNIKRNTKPFPDDLAAAEKCITNSDLFRPSVNQKQARSKVRKEQWCRTQYEVSRMIYKRSKAGKLLRKGQGANFEERSPQMLDGTKIKTEMRSGQSS